ncbi:ubinuclein-2-like [Ovis canadensis]|uniref:ubinuclein-2-like n=1 Tax=Ovis canadensis TaxID=37174 RepID=UPI003753393D
MDVADEGDTPSTSPREGLDHHPRALETQCRLQVSMPMEGSAQLGMKRKQGRPVAQTPPRTHPGAQSQAAMELSTSGSNPELQEPLPLRQQEDLEPSTAEHRGPPAPGTDVPPPQREPPLHLHLHQRGLWQENPSQGMSYHLCRESLPWLLPKTQMPTMTDPPPQGERALALDRDPDPFLETPRPGAWLALQPPSLSISCGRHQLAPHPGEIEFPSPELILIWFVNSFLMIF